MFLQDGRSIFKNVNGGVFSVKKEKKKFGLKKVKIINGEGIFFKKKGRKSILVG